MYIHYDAIETLKEKRFLKGNVPDDEMSSVFLGRFLCGTSILTSGSLKHQSSDLLDSIIKEVIKRPLKREKQVGMIIPFLKENVDELLKKFQFAEKYVEGCTGANSSLMRLKRALGV